MARWNEAETDPVASSVLTTLDARLDAAEASLVSVESDQVAIVRGSRSGGARRAINPDNFIPYATLELAIHAAAAALDAIGGGVVELPENFVDGDWAPIPKTVPLPLYAGVAYHGVMPRVVPIAGRREQDFDFVGGTVFVGDGTFRGVDHTTDDEAAPPDTDGATGTSGVELVNIGFENFSDGVRIGARNVFGLHLNGKIDQIYTKRTPGWGFDLWNCTAIEVGYVRASAFGTGGYRERVDMAREGGSPWNHRIGHVYVNVPRNGDDIGNGQTCPDTRLVRGIAFEVANGGGTAAVGNELTIDRLQCNHFNTTLLSVAATLTSGVAAIAVPDGTKFKVGMPVRFTTTANGFTANLVYVVRSVVANTITVAFGMSSTYPVITPSGSGGMTIESYGFANLEFASLDNSTLINTVVGHIDSEGTVGAGLYLEGLSNCHFRMGDAPSAGTLAQIVGRNVAYSAIHANSPLTNDMDANCSTSMWMGARSGFLNYRMRGLAYDSARNATQLAIAASVTRAPEFESRNNGWVYPGRGIGQHITPRNINTALNGTHAGSLPFVVTAERTCTLPTLVSDATTGTSYVGVIFDIANLTASGGANVIVNTDGTQVFNRVVAKTSHTVAPGTGVIIEGIDLPDGTFCWKAHAYTLITV